MGDAEPFSAAELAVVRGLYFRWVWPGCPRDGEPLEVRPVPVVGRGTHLQVSCRRCGAGGESAGPERVTPFTPEELRAMRAEFFERRAPVCPRDGALLSFRLVPSGDPAEPVIALRCGNCGGSGDSV